MTAQAAREQLAAKKQEWLQNQINCAKVYDYALECYNVQALFTQLESLDDANIERLLNELSQHDVDYEGLEELIHLAQYEVVDGRDENFSVLAAGQDFFFEEGLDFHGLLQHDEVIGEYDNALSELIRYQPTVTWF